MLLDWSNGGQNPFIRKIKWDLLIHALPPSVGHDYIHFAHATWTYRSEASNDVPARPQNRQKETAIHFDLSIVVPQSIQTGQLKITERPGDGFYNL